MLPEIEDEINFIYRCNFLAVVRTALFNSIFETFDEFIHYNDTENKYFFYEAQTRTAFKVDMGSILFKNKLII